MPKNKTDPLPFVAPCRTLSATAPLNWLKMGIRDLTKAPLVSLTIGVAMTALVFATTMLAWRFGSAWIMLSLLCGFVFAAPVACVGTYAVSAQLERGETVTFQRTLHASFKRYIGTELVFALVLLVIFLIWARASSMVSIFLPTTGSYQLHEMTGYLTVLSVIALLFLSITFAASVFALPMIMHRDVDAITATVTSINAVLRNKRVMLVWGSLIAVCLVVGALSAGLLLIFILPAIGHAVWHGYLETIDASAFPRHSMGTTAVARRPNQ